MRRFLLSFLIVALLFTAGKARAQRAIPDDNLAFPVLVSLDTVSSGSGFFLNTESRIYLVTAAHVLFDETSGNLKGKQVTLLSYPKDPKEAGKNLIRLDLGTLFEAKRIRKHSSEDVAVVQVADLTGGADTGS
jgi:S1-C subfamily serine protease